MTDFAHSTASETIITLDNLHEVGDYVEIVDGHPREKAQPVTGLEHMFILRALFRLLDAFVQQHKLGEVFFDGLTYVLHVEEADDTAEKRVRKTRLPDLSFVRGGILKNTDRRKPFMGAPTLAVEVVSASESAAELNDKINDYLTYGAEAVWVIYPEAQKLHVHQPNSKTITVYEADDTLQDEALLPGLSVTIRDLFADEDADA